MKNDTIEIVVKVEIPIQMAKYLSNKSESIGCNDFVISIKPNNSTTIETMSNGRRSHNRMPLYKIYDTNPELFLEVYNKYMNDELSGDDAALILNCSRETFNAMVRYYRDKENSNEVKYRTNKSFNHLAKYTICDKKPKKFLEVYNKFMNKKITGREAAKELELSIATFYRSMKYYKAKNRNQKLD